MTPGKNIHELKFLVAPVENRGDDGNVDAGYDNSFYLDYNGLKLLNYLQSWKCPLQSP